MSKEIKMRESFRGPYLVYEIREENNTEMRKNSLSVIQFD
jgi:hypothetical protein